MENPMSKVKTMKTQKEIEEALEQRTGVSKKEVKAVLQELQKLILQDILKKSGGEIKLKGFIKFATKKKPAVKGGVKKINPLTKQEYVTKDKKASLKLSIRPLGNFAKDLKSFNLN